MFRETYASHASVKRKAGLNGVRVAAKLLSICRGLVGHPQVAVTEMRQESGKSLISIKGDNSGDS